MFAASEAERVRRPRASPSRIARYMRRAPMPQSRRVYADDVVLLNLLLFAAGHATLRAALLCAILMLMLF